MKFKDWSAGLERKTFPRLLCFAARQRAKTLRFLSNFKETEALFTPLSATYASGAPLAPVPASGAPLAPVSIYLYQIVQTFFS